MNFLIYHTTDPSADQLIIFSISDANLRVHMVYYI